jgi:hypothetical protein
MADDIDLANDRVLTETSALIAAASADLPVGHPGDCDLCGEWSGRLIDGHCAPCREKYQLP